MNWASNPGPCCASSNGRCWRTIRRSRLLSPSPGPRSGLSNIQPELSTFIGRTADVAHIVKLLEDRRLVSITGPGGVGKTRIATEVARHPGRTWRDGAWLVELGLQSGDRAVASAFQHTFGTAPGPHPAVTTPSTGSQRTRHDGTADRARQLRHVLAEAADIASAIVRSVRACRARYE